MTRPIHWLIITILLVYGMAWNPTVAQAQGKEIFNGTCAMCHGQDGTGDGPAGKSFSSPPDNFTDPKFWQMGDVMGDVKDHITTTIKNGHGPMPAFSLSDSQINAVIAYMEQKFKP
jgi:mono/diheme cytochrome c family protein